MNKPLKDWTLGEIKAECVKRNAFCEANGKCPFFVPENKEFRCGIRYNIRNTFPGAWDLSEPPCWTEQDVEDAKALKRLIVNAHHVWRYSAESEPQLYDEYETGGLPLNDCFAALPPRTKVTLNEIIGGAE